MSQRGPAPKLLAVPNVSEGRDRGVIDAIGAAFQRDGVRLLDVHFDPDHHRSVFTLAGAPPQLPFALLTGARVALAGIDLRQPRGHHPHVGAIDVVPLVYVEQAARGAACAAALLTADLLAHELDVPVFLYGALADGRTRAQLRRGGLTELTRRMTAGELTADFGPSRPHSSAGAVLVAARPPLVAFNLELAPPAGEREARRIAGLIRQGGDEGLPGLRAIGLSLAARGGVAQVSMNVEDAFAVPLARVVEAVRRHADVTAAELVGLAPRAAFEGFPADVPIRGFDAGRHLIEEALRF